MDGRSCGAGWELGRMHTAERTMQLGEEMKTSGHFGADSATRIEN